MCGIFGYVGNKTNAATIVFEGLKRLEYRGYDSWGIAVVPTASEKSKVKSEKLINTIVVKKKTGKIGNANVNDMPSSSFAFGHTRWATHGGVTQTNAHPHLDCTGRIALIHNGIFENYEGIKKTLVKKGHRFTSETDTEVAVHLIEEYRKTMALAKAVQKAFNDMAGLNAIIVIDSDRNQLIAARNGSPLVIGFGHQENFLASDAAALLPHTKQVHFLEDDEMTIVGHKGIMIFDAKTGTKIAPKVQKLTWSTRQAEKGTYPYFMLKEIHEQPDIIADISETMISPAKRMTEVIRKSQGTYLVGCGTAGYACMAGSYLFSKVAKRHVNWAVGSEFGYQLNFLTKKSLVMALSQSGETIDILESVKKAKNNGASIVALVNVLGSSLYRMADHKTLIGAGPEKAVASTKAFTAKIAYLVLLAYGLAGKTKEGQTVLMHAVSSGKKVLSSLSLARIQKLASRLKNTEHIFVVGRGISYPASLETALKIKEISYIHAEGFAAGELKHGVIALVEKDTPCIVFAPNDEAYGANLAGAMEMKARGGFIVGISHKPHEVFDYYIPVDDACEATIIPNVIVGQLLAYYLAIEKGLDPDMPRNLAKSVTVK
ncbi:glutamine--fructose-6-phosphate transaminase (isomerizing) [Patescibacteria group bacterium]|nr:glutamine--fructose-6-phosphate transaminase (isomerizing) [Patescibacteria group bacterium]MBU1472559.1 glutamine--fructose-6-phosphate transaminase (isomerizing) [Patescibacteria group bacterium]MBU2459810.1 glutamine--fructose-6-phosphate transaminase (isomerizing) [Patescibacteria group bacterium]MBU2544771.1 glutamine--fructose-6-phosphate transaminase (isomerizing) [Patescibacteria group bacterium]